MKARYSKWCFISKDKTLSDCSFQLIAPYKFQISSYTVLHKRASAPKPGKTPTMAARCRRRLLLFKIKVRPRSCRYYPIWRPCYRQTIFLARNHGDHKSWVLCMLRYHLSLLLIEIMKQKNWFFYNLKIVGLVKCNFFKLTF